MSNDGVNTSRRTFLVAATCAVGAAGAVGVAVPFVKSWQPSARAKNAGAPVKADISKIPVGAKATFEWRGRPVWVVRRTKEMLASLPKVDDELKDPKSSVAQQPEYAQNEYRSIKPEYSVLVGICTHLGCSPKYNPDPNKEVGLEYGGYFCPCHGSKFDFAGRVFKGVPAPTNLVVPPHSYLSDSVIIIGSEEGETKA